MRVESLNARVELERLAALFPRAFDEPLDQLLAVALRPLAFVGHQVVDIEHPAREQVLDDPESSQRSDGAVVLEQREPIASLFLNPDASDELLLAQVLAQLVHHWKAGGDLVV